MIRGLYRNITGKSGLFQVPVVHGCNTITTTTTTTITIRNLHTSHPTIDECPDPKYDTGCTYCMPDMAQFPNQSKPLPPSPIHAKQLVICSGTSNWPSKIDGDSSSLAGIIGASKRTLIHPQYPVMITNCDLPPTGGSSESASAFLFPDNLYFDNIPLDNVSEFFQNYVRPSSFESIKSDSIPEPVPASALILICGHTKRDVRCGLVAPLLVAEFTKVLQERGLYYDPEKNPSGIRVSISSHIGGHAFAGNVIYHPASSSPNGLSASIWYGKVFPHHVQGIIDETIINGRVVKSLLRGYGPEKW